MTLTLTSDFDLPLLVAHADALDHNITTMADYCAAAGVLLAPHAKTTMCRPLIEQQLQAGAWGMTVATPRQARALVGFGVQRILLANVLVDERAIRWVSDQFLSGTAGEFLCYVESLDGVDLLERTLDLLSPPRTLPVLLELGVDGGRTGVRSREQARAVAERVAHSAQLSLVGTAAFEGVLRLGEGESIPADLPDFLTFVHDATVELTEAGLFDTEVPIVSAGGSSYFDVVVEQLGPDSFDFNVSTVLRSGCYVSHDHGLYHRTSPLDGRQTPDGPHLRPALELLASVWSRPEPGLVIAGFGRRDVPFDDRLPIVLGHYDEQDRLRPLPGWQVQKLWDQHAWIAVPPDTVISPGDVLSLGISHPCGAFDRWRSIVLLNAESQVIGSLEPAL
ncbi:amino acid deaminase [Microlunatus panaciterrae]|uniref:D-serine deaminase-like pyridoxal phosphate-dependent protein n=1 Tax=Microlunatus panaciterrae TaxID=400768 RepID=A0ABS2RJ39_9ACTN|nr:alanine racemase [Microlunatus panaciterrae]MBM7799010.1 D-serine deaminase-like pyridoxal phosphate-dependent protein [Microlunatus panaciterrae]